LAVPASAAETGAVAQAQTAAVRWLGAVDSAKYGQSWDSAAAIGASQAK
jgi:hypothetical protein